MAFYFLFSIIARGFDTYYRMPSWIDAIDWVIRDIGKSFQRLVVTNFKLNIIRLSKVA